MAEVIPTTLITHKNSRRSRRDALARMGCLARAPVQTLLGSGRIFCAIRAIQRQCKASFTFRTESVVMETAICILDQAQKSPRLRLNQVEMTKPVATINTKPIRRAASTKKKLRALLDVLLRKRLLTATTQFQWIIK
jgi:hypothetical protein